MSGSPGTGGSNPRKFSEKIALHNQKQAEETRAFEQLMTDLTVSRVNALLLCCSCCGTDEAPPSATAWDSWYSTSTSGSSTRTHPAATSAMFCTKKHKICLQQLIVKPAVCRHLRRPVCFNCNQQWNRKWGKSLLYICTCSLHKRLCALFYI